MDTILITPQDIRENTSDIYYQRGIKYYTNSKVLDFSAKSIVDEFDEEVTIIKGRVKGSGGYIYTQGIEI